MCNISIKENKNIIFKRNLQEIKKPTVAILESYSGGEGKELKKKKKKRQGRDHKIVALV